MDKKFNIHDWQAKQRLVEQDEFQKRQDALTPGKNPDAFYGPDSLIAKMKSQESMSNADIKALQTVIGNYSLNKVLNTIAVIADKMGKHDEAEMIKNLASKIQDFEDIEEVNKGFKGDSPFPFRDNPDANDEWSKKRMAQDSATVKKVVNLKMDSEVGEPVTVQYDPKKNLTNVTISWGNESHTVDFEAGDVIDDHGNEGMDIETYADSDDGRWQFILDVQVESTFPQTGDFADYDFDELIVQGHPDNEDHLEPEDRFDQDPVDEQNTTGGGASFNAGNGEGYMTPNAFKKKRK
tara:strand:- start:799 stop:1680 length:882 start_codon:yes stop_codon:yes gene_type:complete